MAVLKLFTAAAPAWLIALGPYRRHQLAIDIKPAAVFFDKFRALMQLSPVRLAVDGYKFYIAAGVILTALVGADYGKRFPNGGLYTFEQVNAVIKLAF